MRKIMRNIIGAAGIALSALAAVSLTTVSFSQVIPSGSTSQRRPVPRYFQEQMVHYIRTTLTFNMCTQAANLCTVQLANASLPYNSIILRVTYNVFTAFNSTTSDVVILGTTSANANEIQSATVDIHTTGVKAGTVLATAFNATGNTATQSGQNGGIDLWLRWTAGTGNTATAGLADVVIEYIASNDGLCAPVPLGAAPAGC